MDPRVCPECGAEFVPRSGTQVCCSDKCKRVPPPLTEIEPGHFVACHRTEEIN